MLSLFAPSESSSSPAASAPAARALVALALALAGLSLALVACSENPPAAGPQSAPAAETPPPLELAAPAADAGPSPILFRYLDPASGEVKSASTVDAIPAPARRQVVVLDPRAEPPAGWDYVADLSAGLPATAVALRDFRFTTRADLAAVVRAPSAPGASTAAGAPREVLLFSTQGCGYCTKARKFLTANRIPFTELDVEEDASAPGRLQAMGQKAGLSARDLQGVPILFIDGKPLVGWDERRVAKMLGLKS